MILPEQLEPPAVPTTPTDGCWRFGGDRHPAIPAIALFGTLTPEESLTTTFAVYAAPMHESCYPPGEYLIRDDIGLGVDRQVGRSLTVTLVIDEAGTFSTEPSPRKLSI